MRYSEPLTFSGNLSMVSGGCLRNSNFAFSRRADTFSTAVTRSSSVMTSVVTTTVEIGHEKIPFRLGLDEFGPCFSLVRL